MSFPWGPDSNTYAVLKSKVALKLYKNFKEAGKGIKYGGPLLGARGNVFMMFWDWDSGEVVRRIDVEVCVSYFCACIYSYICAHLCRSTGHQIILSLLL